MNMLDRDLSVYSIGDILNTLTLVAGQKAWDFASELTGLSEDTLFEMMTEEERNAVSTLEKEDERKEKCIEAKTTAGKIKAYTSTDPGSPGICVMLQPNGTDTEVDLAYACVFEDETYKTKDDEGKEDIVIYTYGDIYTEEWTRKEIIREKDIKEALAEEYREE